MSDIAEKQHQITLRRLVLLFIAASWVYRGAGHALLHQMEAPILFNNGLDLSYWLLWGMGIPSFLTGYWPGLLLSICMAVLLVTAWFKPLKGMLFFWIAAVYLLYIMIYNLYSGHHTHCALGLFLAALALSVSKVQSFNLSWNALRLYTCFLYGSAFLWKLFRGSLWHDGQAHAVMESNLAWYMQLHPGTALTQMYEALLIMPALLTVLYLFAMLLEAVFLVGFFTKRWDGILLIAPVLLHSGTYFMADVMFFEILVLNLAFVSARQWTQLNTNIEKVKKKIYASTYHSTR